MGMSITERLNMEAAGWKPEPGATLVGTVIDTSEREGDFGVYPIVTVSPEGGGDPIAIHAFHFTLRGKLAENKVEVGDEIGVRYIGKVQSKTKGGADYHSYKLVSQKGSDASVDWAKQAAIAAAEAFGVEEPF